MIEKLIMLLAFIGPILGWFLRKYWEQKFKKELESHKSTLRIKESKDTLLNKKKLNTIEQIEENIDRDKKKLDYKQDDISTSLRDLEKFGLEIKKISDPKKAKIDEKNLVYAS